MEAMKAFAHVATDHAWDSKVSTAIMNRLSDADESVVKTALRVQSDIYGVSAGFINHFLF